MEVITIGETLGVLVATSPGPLRYNTHFALKTGGAETNLAVGITRLGHPAGWISRLGDDEFGRLIFTVIRGEGVDVSRVKFDPAAPTGVFFKERREVGESRNFYYRKGSAASLMGPEDIDEEYIKKGRLLHVTGITAVLSDSCLAALEKAIEIARKNKILVSFDPNLRLKLCPREKATPILLSLMGKADIVLPGLEEAQILLGETDPGKIIDGFRALGSPMVALKMGAGGAMIAKGKCLCHIPAFPVKHIVDPFGAGDAFAAGFLAGILEGASLEEAGRMGNAAGAFVLGVTGNIEALPSREEIRSFMEGKEILNR